MDRNPASKYHRILLQRVALRKESVDRNRELLHPSCTAKMSLSARRAWIEMRVRGYSQFSHRSLSARRAWIEMPLSGVLCGLIIKVALRKESVDRNLNRRFRAVQNTKVALRKESVDRNCDLEPIRNAEAGRSPQGERG